MSEHDTREWRVGAHYGVHVYAVNPDGDDEPIASFLGEPEGARRRAEQMVAEHAAARDSADTAEWISFPPPRDLTPPPGYEYIAETIWPRPARPDPS